jgi:hypothetical protein
MHGLGIVPDYRSRLRYGLVLAAFVRTSTGRGFDRCFGRFFNIHLGVVGRKVKLKRYMDKVRSRKWRG